MKPKADRKRPEISAIKYVFNIECTLFNVINDSNVRTARKSTYTVQTQCLQVAQPSHHLHFNSNCFQLCFSVFVEVQLKQKKNANYLAPMQWLLRYSVLTSVLGLCHLFDEATEMNYIQVIHQNNDKHVPHFGAKSLRILNIYSSG